MFVKTFATFEVESMSLATPSGCVWINLRRGNDAMSMVLPMVDAPRIGDRLAVTVEAVKDKDEDRA